MSSEVDTSLSNKYSDMEDIKHASVTVIETLKIRDDFGELGLKMRTILKWILKMKVMRMCYGFILCRIWLG
jgi:hypothetical protein